MLDNILFKKKLEDISILSNILASIKYHCTSNFIFVLPFITLVNGTFKYGITCQALLKEKFFLHSIPLEFVSGTC